MSKKQVEGGERRAEGRRGGERKKRGTRTCWNMSGEGGGRKGHAAGAGRLGGRSPAGLGGETSLTIWGSPEPWKSSYPEVNERVVTLELLIFPSV